MALFDPCGKYTSIATRIIFTSILACGLLAVPLKGWTIQTSSPGGENLGDLDLAELMQLKVETVTVASKFAQKVTDAPASISVITAEEIRRIDKISEAGGCQILFISRSEQRRLSALLAALKGHNTLTVSDIDGFAHEGGMIQLLLQDNQVRFEINLRAAQAAELTISSNLLKLATTIRE